MTICFTRFVFLLFLFSLCLTSASAYQSSSQSGSSSSPANATPETSPPTTLTDISNKLDALNEEAKGQNQSTLITIAASFSAALLGAAIALYTSFAQRKYGAKSLLLDSLKWFEGGIQKRGIGISIIDGHWEESQFSDLRATWVSLLSSQAVYILSKSYEEEKGKPILLPEHEFLNLERIIKLLKLGIPQVKGEVLAGDPTNEVKDAFTKAMDKHRAEARNPSNHNFLTAILASQDRLHKIKANF